jgi:lipopolysaccharide/colanic/teichoic acid biosynthesis glycosyltransferase
MYRGKRAMDLSLAWLGWFAVSPLLLACLLAVYVKMGRPVIFAQPRAGLGGRRFLLLKLRTMSDQRGPDGELLPDEQRLGSLGRFLRASSLDELPTLINVINGEMSLVGPRPLHMAYLRRYTPEQARRHEVKPGLTGWAQVNGRNAISWPQKFALDVWYVDHCSLTLDLGILMLTVRNVLRREGINQEGQATMEEFMG